MFGLYGFSNSRVKNNKNFGKAEFAMSWDILHRKVEIICIDNLIWPINSS